MAPDQARAHATRCRRARGRCGLTPHHDEAVDSRDGCEHQHDPQDRHQDVECQADPEQDQALESLDEPAAGREAQGVCFRPFVRHEHRKRHDRKREHRELRAFCRQMPRDPTEQGSVGNSVTHRVEERAPVSRRAAVTRDRTIEDVGQATQDDAEDRKKEVAVRDQPSRRERGDETEDRQAVGRDARGVQRSSDRRKTFFSLGAPASVEHEGRRPFAARGFDEAIPADLRVFVFPLDGPPTLPRVESDPLCACRPDG